MVLELEKLVNDLSEATSSDKWEDRYHSLFERYSALKQSLDHEIRQRKDIESSLKGLTNEKKVLLEKQKESEEYILEISSASQTQRKEIAKLNENLRTSAKKHLDEKERQREEKQMMSHDIDVKKHKIKKLANNIENLRKDVSRLNDKCDMLQNENKSLEEKKKDLECIIEDYRVGAAMSDVKVFDNFDRVFSKYLESFHGDESEVRQLFQDRVTQGSNAAFKMLISLCFEDLIQNFSSISTVIVDLETLIELTVTLDIYLQINRYMRVLQYKYVHLFSAGGEDALKKSYAMTKHKMKYEEIELGNARQAFILILLSKIENQKIINKPQQFEKMDIEIPKKQQCKEKAAGF